MQRKLNLHYAAVHGSYWMSFGVLYSFSSVFLLGRGYSNASIGLILALGNLIAVLVQPFLAHLADRRSKGTVFAIMETMGLASVLLLVLMLTIKGTKALAVIYVAAIALLMMQQPFANAVNRRLEETGVRIAFGSCRSIGSLTFAIICYVMGKVADAKGIGLIPVFGLFAFLIFIGVVYKTQWEYASAMRRRRREEALYGPAGETRQSPRPAGRGEAKGKSAGAEVTQNGAAADIPEAITFGDFVETHKVFLIMSVGILGLWFANAIPNSYMAQMVTHVGGDSGDTGKIFAALALSEIPTMLVFDRLYRRFKTESMLIFASVAFVIWTAAMGLAQSVNGILLAQLIHLFCFPLFLPAIVRFIDDNMREGEAVKGQTVFTMVGTISGILASLVGGILLDKTGPKAMMFVAVVAALIGAAIIFTTIYKVKKRN